MFRSVVEGSRLLLTTHDICGPKLAHKSLEPSFKIVISTSWPATNHPHHPHPSPSTSLLQGQEPSFFRPNRVNSSRRVAEYLQLVEQWNRLADSAMDLIWCSIYQYLIVLLSTLIQWDQQISFSSKPGYLILPWIPFSTILVGQTMILLQTLQMNCACQLPVWVRPPRRHQMRNGSK